MDSSPSAQETDTVDVLLDPEMPCNALGSGVCDAESESVEMILTTMRNCCGTSELITLGDTVHTHTLGHTHTPSIHVLLCTEDISSGTGC